MRLSENKEKENILFCDIMNSPLGCVPNPMDWLIIPLGCVSIPMGREITPMGWHFLPVS